MIGKTGKGKHKTQDHCFMRTPSKIICLPTPHTSKFISRMQLFIFNPRFNADEVISGIFIHYQLAVNIYPDTVDYIGIGVFYRKYHSVLLCALSCAL